MVSESPPKGDHVRENGESWKRGPPAGTLDNIRRFVHQWFAWLDKGVSVDRLATHLAPHDLQMHLPEGRIVSHREFRAWHSSLAARYTKLRHELYEIYVSWDRDDGYGVDLYGRRLVRFRRGGLERIEGFRQRWRVRISDGGTLQIVRLESYLL